MTDKTAKKSKKAKEVIVVTPPTRPIDSMVNEEKIAALIALQSTPGWAIIVQVLKENQEYLRATLEDGYNPEDGKKLTPEEQDEVRYKIRLNRDVMNTPAGYIEALQRANGEGSVEYDPYYKTNADIMRDKKAS